MADVQVKDNVNAIHNINVDTLGDGSDTQMVKLQLGPLGVDGGLVTNANPMPTQDQTADNLYNILALLLDRLEFGMNTDSSKKLKINLVDSGALANVTTVGTVTTCSTVTTVAGVTNHSRIGDVQAQRHYEALADMAFADGMMSKITF